MFFRRLSLICLLLCCIPFLWSVDKVKLARLNYDGGGDWYNDPDILPNIANYINQTLCTDFDINQAVVRASDKNLMDYPFLFLTGHGNIRFNDKEIENLRRYLLQGGFLYADDDYGMDTAFRREIKRVFPEKELVELPSSHPLFNCYNAFPNGVPKIHEHDKKRPQVFALFDDFGRIMVLYTYETNISDGWAGPTVHNDPPEIREKAFQFGANIFYLLLSGGSS